MSPGSPTVGTPQSCGEDRKFMEGSAIEAAFQEPSWGWSERRRSVSKAQDLPGQRWRISRMGRLPMGNLYLLKQAGVMIGVRIYP